MKHSKRIELSDQTKDKLMIIAVKEKRRGKTDLKNFIEHLCDEYAEKHSESKKEIMEAKGLRIGNFVMSKINGISSIFAT
jgi:hypothetical protein